PRVDALGQAARRDFPGKAKDAAELAADVPGQEAFFAAFAPAELDEFGGLPGSGEKLGLKKTGFFHVERHGERWLLVDPAGNAFFQLGVCCVAPHNDATLTRGRESAFAWLPEREGKFAAAWHPEPFWNGQAVSFYTANLIRKFGDADPDKHLERMIGRLRRAGFNSHGAWSRVSPVSRRLNWPYTAFLPIEQWVLGQPMLPGVRGMFDPFAPATRAAVEKRFAEVLPQAADDPLLIGYFLENEQGLEDLPRAVAALSGEHACKQRLAAWLEKKYGDVAAFNRAWGLSAPAFAEVAARPLPLKTPAAFADMGEFAGLFLDAYHGMLRELFDKYDRNHMLIGGRWQPGTANSEILCRSAGKYMDVISVNYYAYGIDEAFVRRLYRWSGEKPMLWSEFHYGSGRDSGLPGRMDVGSQEARGLAYRNYVEGAAALGFVVGTQWFQCIDEPLTGRYFEEYNGENYNIGLFSVVDRPYREVLTAMAATHARIYDVWLNGAAPYRFEHPLFSPKARAAAARRAVVRRV
ncbi:MAG: beta-galactosidase, partial [Planctomycetes bacterium]|nr:beta-galactosidase [Planctomycetota bacterium]